MGKNRVTTHILTELIRRYVGPGRALSVAECAARTGFSESCIEKWIYGDAEPRSYGLWCLAEVLGEQFKRDLMREWLGLTNPDDEMTREIGALLATAGFVVKRSRAA